MKSDLWENRWKTMHASTSRLHRHEVKGVGTWVDGVVPTPEGFVSCYIEPPEMCPPNGYVAFDFIHDGYWYRSHPVEYTSLKGLAVTARRWAERIAAEANRDR